jgi:hypothetical protein
MAKMNNAAMKAVAENNSSYCQFPKPHRPGGMKLLIGDGHVAISLWPSSVGGWEYADQASFAIALAHILNPSDKNIAKLAQKAAVKQKVEAIRAYKPEAH